MSGKRHLSLVLEGLEWEDADRGGRLVGEEEKWDRRVETLVRFVEVFRPALSYRVTKETYLPWDGEVSKMEATVSALNFLSLVPGEPQSRRGNAFRVTF